MRGILALAAALCCAGLGTHLSRQLKQRERLMDDWEGAVSSLQSCVDQGGMGLESMLTRTGRGLPPLSELARRLGENPAALPETLLQNLPWDPLLTEAEKEALQECLEAFLTASTPDAQKKALEREKETILRFQKACRDEREKNGRLYQSLGWLSGAALYILLC